MVGQENGSNTMQAELDRFVQELDLLAGNLVHANEVDLVATMAIEVARRAAREFRLEPDEDGEASCHMTWRPADMVAAAKMLQVAFDDPIKEGGAILDRLPGLLACMVSLSLMVFRFLQEGENRDRVLSAIEQAIDKHLKR